MDQVIEGAIGCSRFRFSYRSDVPHYIC